MSPALKKILKPIWTWLASHWPIRNILARIFPPRDDGQGAFE